MGTGEVLDHKRGAQWEDKGTYKEPKDSDNIRVPRLEIDDATTYIDKDGSDNLTVTDAVTGTKTLAELSAGGIGDMLKSVYDPNDEGEIRLTPKASSTGAEGTIFYDSDDDHVYVATE